jgi:hypothetical protein
MPILGLSYATSPRKLDLLRRLALKLEAKNQQVEITEQCMRTWRAFHSFACSHRSGREGANGLLGHRLRGSIGQSLSRRAPVFDEAARPAEPSRNRARRDHLGTLLRKGCSRRHVACATYCGRMSTSLRNARDRVGKSNTAMRARLGTSNSELRDRLVSRIA